MYKLLFQMSEILQIDSCGLELEWIWQHKRAVPEIS